MTRDEFRLAVFDRDGHKCVICGAQAQDAHHIMERRLFADGGYRLDNGASLCGKHHVDAEKTTLTCEEIRTACGISKVILPEHLYDDTRYDKWGNPFVGLNRSRGELYHDESVQKILPDSVKSTFVQAVKYPRTYHLPWSPGATSDDRVMKSTSGFHGQNVVVTEKMDGENTTFYSDRLHARSICSEDHSSRHWIKGLHGRIGWNIPNGWRICLENLFAKHSIEYHSLPSYAMMFSIWDDKNNCLSWDETTDWAELIGIDIVPVLYCGIYDELKIKSLFTPISDSGSEMEGYVVRLASKFNYRHFSSSVGKYVRANHVQTNQHWKRTWTMNKLSHAK